MKKLIVTALVASTIATSAFAKTEGNYVGLNFVQSYLDSNGGQNLQSAGRATSRGVGVNYKYAFNMDNFFVAPGAFIDHNNASSSLTNVDAAGMVTGSQRYSISSTYGVRADLGYDVDEKVALYAIVGEQANRFKANNANPKTGTAYSLVYGVGSKIALGQYTSLNLEYTTTNFKVKDGNQNKVKMGLDTVKVGLAYNF